MEEAFRFWTKIQLMKNILLISLLAIFLIACKSDSSNNTIPSVVKGKIERINNFQSKYVPDRIFDVWLPENYSEDQKYPVLYMHDGQNLFDANVTWNNQEWGVDDVISKLIDEDKIDPVIVVGIWNGGKGRHAEYFPQKPFEKLKNTLLSSEQWQGSKKFKRQLKKFNAESDVYLKFLTEELIPYIDKNYSTEIGMEHTFVGGSSMGGLISIYALCEYPEIFGGAACFSTHWPGLTLEENNPIPGAFVDYLNHSLPDPANHKIYFDFGTETLDSLYEPYQRMVDGAMMMNSYNESSWMTKKYEGHDHSEKSWNKRFHVPMEFLLEKK